MFKVTIMPIQKHVSGRIKRFIFSKIHNDVTPYAPYKFNIYSKFYGY